MNEKTVINIEEQIAKVCHEANRAYCESMGDFSQASWEDAEQWQKDSAVAGVQYTLLNLGTTVADQHQAWMAFKLADGWKYGPVKDAALKQHPLLLPFEKLRLEERRKDFIFRAIVRAFVESEGESC